jgi:hypothetical protein
VLAGAVERLEELGGVVAIVAVGVAQAVQAAGRLRFAGDDGVQRAVRDAQTLRAFDEVDLLDLGDLGAVDVTRHTAVRIGTR